MISYFVISCLAIFIHNQKAGCNQSSFYFNLPKIFFYEYLLVLGSSHYLCKIWYEVSGNKNKDVNRVYNLIPWTGNQSIHIYFLIIIYPNFLHIYILSYCLYMDGTLFVNDANINSFYVVWNLD